MKIKTYEDMYKDRIPYLPKAEQQLVMFQQELINGTYRDSEGDVDAFQNSGIILQGLLDDNSVKKLDIIKVILHSYRQGDSYCHEILERVAMCELEQSDAEYLYLYMQKSARKVFLKSPNVRYQLIFRGLAALHPEWWPILANNPAAYSGDIKFLYMMLMEIIRCNPTKDKKKSVWKFNDVELYELYLYGEITHMPVWMMVNRERVIKELRILDSFSIKGDNHE